MQSEKRKIEIIIPRKQCVESLTVLAVMNTLQTNYDIIQRDIPLTSMIVTEDNETTKIDGAYAICKYLIEINDQVKNTLFKANSREVHWEIHDWIFKVLFQYKNIFASVNKQLMEKTIIDLKEYFEKNNNTLLSNKSMEITLADYFIGAMLESSCQSSNILKHINEGPILAYRERIKNDIGYKKALSTEFQDKAFSLPEIHIESKKMYLTTSISYTNSYPHIGHAYENILADTYRRYYKICGHDVRAMTGTDEHGQKIAQTAEKQNITPLEMSSFYMKQFLSLNEKLDFEYDVFVRTTSDIHKAQVTQIWNLCKNRGDIYLGKYVGWYNVREENFVSETEAASTNYTDPATGVPYKKMEEPSYFFRLSKYQDIIKKYIEENPQFIVPKIRRNDILARLKTPVEDLSVSRVNFKWGIPVPDDPDHVMYVWFDALTSYLTGTQYFENNSEFKSYWPAEIQIIGKDITWFHTVIWPCMLISAGVPLPKTVLCHGFILAGDGRKISKSFNNVIDPVEILNKFPNSDVLRFSLLKTAELGRDIRIHIDNMIDYNNSDLGDTFGNMVHRAFGLCKNYNNDKIPCEGLPEGSPPLDAKQLKNAYILAMNDFCTQEAIEAVFAACRDANKYLTMKAPWTLKDPLEKKKVTRAMLETVYYLSHFLYPIIPCACKTIAERLKHPLKNINDLSVWFDNLIPGTTITQAEVLFSKIEC